MPEPASSTCGHPTDEDDTTGFCARPLGHPFFDQDGIGCSLDADPTSDSGGRSAHKPFPDDGVMYCGWDGHEGCGETWPCSTVRGTRPTTDSGESGESDACTCDDNEALLRDGHRTDCPYLDGPRQEQVPNLLEALRDSLLPRTVTADSGETGAST